MDPPAELLEDIDFKFILTAPKETLKSPEQSMFLVEHAYWHYEDQVRITMPHLRHFGSLLPFAKMMFAFSGAFKQYAGKFDEIWERFNKYKRSIPVFGAILLDDTLNRVLLVRGLKTGSGWGFPRGKVNEKEPGIVCAGREVMEETGIDVEHLLDEKHVLEVTADGKLCTLFIVAGIDPATTAFAPQTQGEIGGYAWHYISDLPSTIDEANKVYLSSTGTKHRFFMVQPFVRPLRNWITNRKVELGLLPASAAKGKGKGSQVMKRSDVAAALREASSSGSMPAGSPAPGITSDGGYGTQQPHSSGVLDVPVMASLVPVLLVPSQSALSPGPSLLSGFRFDTEAIMRCFAT